MSERTGGNADRKAVAASAMRGAGNHNWKGGRTIASNGYVLVKMPEHPDADSRGYVYEHRLVAAEKIGRPLRPGEQVHHINHDRQDNSRGNIEVYESCLHHRFEHRRGGQAKQLPDEQNVTISCACGCGTEFLRYDRVRRERKFVSGHNIHPARRNG